LSCGCGSGPAWGFSWWCPPQIFKPLHPALTGQQPIAELPQGAIPAAAAQDPVGLAAQARSRIGRGDQQSGRLTDDEVVEVVAEEGGLLAAHGQLVAQLFEPRAFVAHPNPAVADVEMAGPLLTGAAPATAEQGHRDAGLLLPFTSRDQAMAKKTVVVWANCQGGSLTRALRDMHSDELEVHLFMNYEFIKNGLELPAFIKSADRFLYQNYRPQEVGMYDLDWISRNTLPANCQKVSFPTLHSIALQFCYDYHEPNNSRTQGPDLPHGAFCYGIKPLADYYSGLVQDSKIKEERICRIPEAVKHALADEFMPTSDVEDRQKISLDFLAEKTRQSDAPGIYDYLLDNYRSVRLWHNPYHPNGVLLDELYRQVFDTIGLPYSPSPSFLSDLDDHLKDWVLPILPSVQASIGLNAGTYCESKYHPEINTTEAYLSKYLECL